MPFTIGSDHGQQFRGRGVAIARREGRAGIGQAGVHIGGIGFGGGTQFCQLAGIGRILGQFERQSGPLYRRVRGDLGGQIGQRRLGFLDQPALGQRAGSARHRPPVFRVPSR